MPLFSISIYPLSSDQSESSLLEALLDALAPYGLLLPPGAPASLSPRGCRFQVLRAPARTLTPPAQIDMPRTSEALSACAALNNASLSSIGALCQTLWLGPPVSCQLTFHAASPVLDTLLKRRFACCGSITAISQTDKTIIVIFADAASAARAREDIEQRQQLPEGLLLMPLEELHEDDRDLSTKKRPSMAPVDDSEDKPAVSTKKRSSTAQPPLVEDLVQAASVSANKRPSPAQPPSLVEDLAKDDNVPTNKRPPAAQPPLVEESTDEDTVSTNKRPAAAKPPAEQSADASDSSDEDDKPPDVLSTKKRASSPSSSAAPSSLLTKKRVTAFEPAQPQQLLQQPLTDSAAAKKKRQHVSDSPQEDCQLFVVHSKSSEVADVVALFAPRPGFVAIDVKRNKRSGGVRGVAFVTFASREQAQATVDELNGLDFPPNSSSTLKVMFCSSSPKPASSAPPSPLDEPPVTQFFDYATLMYQQQQQQQALAAEYELERELAMRSGQASSTDVLADAFGSVMGFAQGYVPPYGGLPPPNHFAQPAPDASRLHIVFAKGLPSAELNAAFQQVAPGLLYISRHRDKPCAFVKYTTATSALLAMIRLNGTYLGGQRLRITLADPVALDPNMGRKRPRDQGHNARGGSPASFGPNGLSGREDEGSVS